MEVKRLKTLIYYFTGTGNSLAIALELAARLGADLQAMKVVVDNDEIEIKGVDCLGLVFPVYNPTFHRTLLFIKT